jgi:hypothetical protein
LITLIVVVLSALGVSSPALAHDPIFLTDDQTTPDTGPYLPDGAISWAIYGTFPEAGETRGFEFDLRDGDELYVGLLIPNLEPEISLPDAELPYVELTMPDGSVRTLEAEIREVFDEQFSQTSYLTLVEIKEPGLAGRHSVLVHSLAPSRFVVAVGEREVFFTPAERTVDRPSDFMGIAEPLNVWYQTPPGESPADVSAGEVDEVQVDVEALEDELEVLAEAEAAAAGTVPDETLPLEPGDDAATSGAAESGMVDDSADDGDDGDDGDTDDGDEVAVAAADAAAEPEAVDAAPAGGGVEDDDDGSGLGWVVPVAIALAAAGGLGFWLTKRRSVAA